MASFSVDYLQSSLDIEKESLLNGVSLSNKDGQIYFTFNESNQEMSAYTAVGLLFLYEFYCLLRQEGQSVSSFFSTMLGEWSPTLALYKPIYAVASAHCILARFPTFSRPPTSSVSK